MAVLFGPIATPLDRINAETAASKMAMVSSAVCQVHILLRKFARSRSKEERHALQRKLDREALLGGLSSGDGVQVVDADFPRLKGVEDALND